MRITVFGATGKAGLQIVDLALLRNFQVRAFSPNVFDTFLIERENLELMKGYVFQEDDLKTALQRCDAVISALGGGTDGTDKTRSLGMKKIVAAMEKHGPRRIVAIGGTSILNANEEEQVYEMEDFPQDQIPLAKEHLAAWKYLQNSHLDWTFVCPPFIPQAEYTGLYLTRKDYHPEGGSNEIRGGDLADFILRELSANNYLNCRVGIANAHL
jgi:putative NADH-flavin reductase